MKNTLHDSNSEGSDKTLAKSIAARREELLDAGILDGPRSIEGIKLRAFSFGSLQLCRVLKLTLFTEEADPYAEEDEGEDQRQLVAFAWLQSEPLDEVLEAVADGTAEAKILKFSFTLDLSNLTPLMNEVNRISSGISAAAFEAHPKHKGSTDSPPGKS